ncbi:MAG: F0F1 ATP synthase subunit B [Bacteroidetes bacterium]|nr:F0F1 ATP synthase subunit B [Bacteroidota bacterium]
MELIKPSLGLIFWMLIAFFTLLFVLGKFAWKPIMNALSEREKSISDALDVAKRTKEEMAQIQSDNQRILAEARNERDLLLKEARDTKDKIINDAKGKAQEEADRLIKIARENIQNEKMAAITELKNQVANLSVDIAQKLLTEELSSPDKQKILIKALLENVNLN